MNANWQQPPGAPPGAPPVAYGPPPAGGYAPPPAQQPAEPPKPGCLIPGIWAGIAAVVTLIALVLVAIMASGSETAGVNATTLASLPVGVVWGGSLASVIIHLAFKKASSKVRIGAPIGCGCLGGIFLLALVFIFFQAIFPAL
ncbi:MAG: hypothetical protein ABIJ56_17345 [Pseudomonadota bacterium]